MNNTTPPATSASLAPHTLAMSCYGYDSRKPKKCRKQLNGHLSFQTTITNRLESTFPPHLCKKIKFVPDSRQPFENGRIFNLAVGLYTTAEMTRVVTPLGVICQVDVDIQGDAVIWLTRMPAPRTPKRHKNDRKVGFRPHQPRPDSSSGSFKVAILLRSAYPWLKPACHIRLSPASTSVLFKLNGPTQHAAVRMFLRELLGAFALERHVWGSCLSNEDKYHESSEDVTLNDSLGE